VYFTTVKTQLQDSDLMARFFVPSSMLRLRVASVCVFHYLSASISLCVCHRVWSSQPNPSTIASTMSKSVLTSLEWANKADRLVEMFDYLLPQVSELESMQVYITAESNNAVDADSRCM